MTRISTLTLLLMLPIMAFAQPQNEIDNIKSLCGCYEVTFKYSETFSEDSSYEFHDKKVAHATELILPIEEEEGKISLQHMLVVNEHYIIKHWREDWVYEEKDLLNYVGDNTWEKSSDKSDKVKGKWTQTVWQVDDMPRYQGYSSWINNNGKTYWENTAYAPLPRREYTTRNDYNIMKRTNRIVITDNGWLHEQDNDKIIRDESGDKLLVKEKGLNSYVKIDNSKCAAAQKNWEESKGFWMVVRKSWNKYIGKGNTLNVKWKVEDERMYEHFYALEADWKENKLADKELSKKVDEVMKQFVTMTK